MRLMRVRHQHVILEVTVGVVNEVLGLVTPLFYCHGSFCTVCGTAVFVRVLNVTEIPFAVLALAFMAIPAIFALTFVGYCILRLTEDLRSESMDIIDWLEHQMFNYECQQHQRNAWRQRVDCRVFRRRAVAIRMNFFYQLEIGAGLDYLLVVLDKAVSLIMMVDSNHPTTLVFHYAAA